MVNLVVKGLDGQSFGEPTKAKKEAFYRYKRIDRIETIADI